MSREFDIDCRIREMIRQGVENWTPVDDAEFATLNNERVRRMLPTYRPRGRRR